VTATPLLSVQDLQVRYGAVPALHGVSLQVGAQQAVALLGANGAGKSTLMKAVIGLLPTAAGRILLDGRPIEGLPADRRARLGIGYCPEGRRVFPGLTVRENLLVACWGNAKLRERRVEGVYALFPALAEYRRALAWQLSGGQQQMLAIGRSLMDAPRLLLLDEPSLGLSPRLTDEVLGRVPAIVAGGTAVLLAEQNAVKALRIATSGVLFARGRVAAVGSAAELATGGDLRAAFLGG
jgi:branched-chain amino acid transport system ATP-binding protein